MPKIFKRVLSLVYVILIVLFSLPLNSVAVWAVLPRETLRQYGLNNTYYYDPYACNDGTSGTTFCAPISGENITWIGDSNSTGAQEIIEREFPGIDFGGEVNTDQATIQVCKFVGMDTTCFANPTNPSGLKVLQRVIDAGNLKPYLVFALGDNGGWSNSDAEEFNKIMSKHPETKVVLVASQTPVEDYTESNEILKKMVNENNNYALADWTTAYKASYYDGDPEKSHPVSDGGFDEWVRVIKEAIGQNCTAGLLAGNSIGEKIWNYFVQANIDGVSDNPAAIAGILGNFYTESGLNPFMNGSTGDYYRGLYMLNSDNGSELWSAITSTVGKDYWEFYGWWCGVSDYPGGSSCADGALAQKNVPQDAIDTAIKMELDYLVLGEINGQKASDQSFHNEFESFVKNFSVISDKNSPRSYAELFLVLVEIAYETSSVGGEALQDAGVRAFGISQGHERWQGAKSRGDYAEEFYKKYSNITTPTTTTTASSGGTSITAASSGGFVKYSDLTDDQIWDLAEVAMNENGVNMTGFKNELSIMANLAEANGSQPPSGNNLVNYIANGGWFATSGYMNGSHDENIDAQYIDATRDVLMNGNRTLPTQILEHDCIKCGAGVDHAYNDESHSVDIIDDYSQWQRGVTVLVQDSGGLSGSWVFYDWMGGEPGLGDPMGYFADNPPTETVVASNSKDMGNCPDDKGSVGGIAGGDSIAQAAVMMAWPVQSGQGDDAHVGKCKNSSGVWETYNADSYPFSCPTNPRDFYREQLDTWLPGGNALDCGIYVTTVLRYVGAMDSDDHYSLEAYFETNDMWEHLSDYSVGNLRPGDVLFSPGHVFLYVGEYGGSYGTIASASLDERVGQVTDYYNEGITNSAWRYKGNLGGGLTSEQAERLADNYNNNVGNWDGTVAAEGNYCQSAECASRYSNCVLLSAFFLEKFVNGIDQQGWPNGGDVVDTLSGMGFDTGAEPQVFSVFSYPTDAGGHTGVVVRIDGDTVYTVEAGYPSWPGAVVGRSKQEFAGNNARFAYVGDKVDTSELTEYINMR